MRAFLSALDAIGLDDDPRVIRFPACVKGRLIPAPKVTYADAIRALAATDVATATDRLARAYVIRARPDQYLVFPRVPTGYLISANRAEAIAPLTSLAFAEVQAYVARLGRALADAVDELGNRLERVDSGGPSPLGSLKLMLKVLPTLFNPAGIAEAVDRELASEGVPGRAFLDGWVPVATDTKLGITARASAALCDDPSGTLPYEPFVRAIPTRQLHVTAGNAPLLPLLSYLRALSTKGVAVVKIPSAEPWLLAILAIVVATTEVDHPLTHATTLTYWKGGDRDVEDALLGAGAFDRLIFWGSSETLANLTRRGGTSKTIVFRPRYGVSIIGGETFPDQVREAAVRGASDSVIAEQQACTASLVHYVQGTEAQVLDYCRALQGVLAQWDERYPAPRSPSSLGRLRTLWRGDLLEATWFVNTIGAEPSSAVVYAPQPFDLSKHPLGRCVIVRRVAAPGDAVGLLSPSVSTVGVFPESLRLRLRDDLAAAGVGSLLPLGEGERVYPGMPHDGIRSLSELVDWTNA